MTWIESLRFCVLNIDKKIGQGFYVWSSTRVSKKRSLAEVFLVGLAGSVNGSSQMMELWGCVRNFRDLSFPGRHTPLWMLMHPSHNITTTASSTLSSLCPVTHSTKLKTKWLEKTLVIRQLLWPSLLCSLSIAPTYNILINRDYIYVCVCVISIFG